MIYEQLITENTLHWKYELHYAALSWALISSGYSVCLLISINNLFLLPCYILSWVTFNGRTGKIRISYETSSLFVPNHSFCFNPEYLSYLIQKGHRLKKKKERKDCSTRPVWFSNWKSSWNIKGGYCTVATNHVQCLGAELKGWNGSSVLDA